MTNLDIAYDALVWADESSATHQAQAAVTRTSENDAGSTKRLPTSRSTTPPAGGIDSLTSSSLTGWGRSAVSMPLADGIGPLVVIGWPLRKIPQRGWQDAFIWTGQRYQWIPEDEPKEPTLYPKAARLNLPGSDKWQPSYGSRTLTIAVLNKPADAPNDQRGTRALVAACIACQVSAAQLRDEADSGDVLASTARRYRAEASALEEHASACEAALPRSLAWLDDFQRNLEPIPPFAPILIPAQLRGYAVLSPI